MKGDEKAYNDFNEWIERDGDAKKYLTEYLKAEAKVFQVSLISQEDLLKIGRIQGKLSFIQHLIELIEGK